ncbi:MAG TPA: ABC transporter substrate-binding protein [Chloroflexota bacterium]
MPVQPTLSKLGRRDAIRMLVSATGIALLAACQPSAPISAPTAAPAPKPTTPPAAPQPTAAATSASSAGADRPAQAGFLAVGVSPSATAPLTAPKGQPRTGGTLRIGNLGDLPNVDGHWISGQNVTYPVFDRLVDLDAALQPHPALAESWDVNADFTQITFRLRKGVSFHSGRELTAEDIAWNYNRIKSDRKIDGGIKANFFVPLGSTETPDKYILVLHATQPWPAVFNVLAWTNILDPQVPPEQNKPAGTGPFTFVEWVQGDHVTLKKNPNYWQSGKPYLDGIEIKILSDPQSMVSQLEGGGIDVAITPLIRDAIRLAKDSKYQVVYNQNSGSVNVILAQTRDGAGPTTNKVFRQALNAAIDRQRWAETVLPGVGAAKNLPVVQTNPAYDAAQDQAVAFDLDKAKSLLTQSHVSNAQLEAVYSAAAPDYQSVLQIWQQDLAKIGVTLTLKSTEPVAYVDQLFNSKFGALIGGNSLFGQLHPAFFWGNAYYSPDRNWANFKSDEYSKIADGLLKETDPAKQKQVYGQWINFLQDQAWVFPWSNTVPRAAATAKVQGLTYNMTEFLMPNDAWLAA